MEYEYIHPIIIKTKPNSVTIWWHNDKRAEAFKLCSMKTDRQQCTTMSSYPVKKDNTIYLPLEQGERVIGCLTGRGTRSTWAPGSRKTIRVITTHKSFFCSTKILHDILPHDHVVYSNGTMLSWTLGSNRIHMRSVVKPKWKDISGFEESSFEMPSGQILPHGRSMAVLMEDDKRELIFLNDACAGLARIAIPPGVELLPYYHQTANMIFLRDTEKRTWIAHLWTDEFGVYPRVWSDMRKACEEFRWVWSVGDETPQNKYQRALDYTSWQGHKRPEGNVHLCLVVDGYHREFPRGLPRELPVLFLGVPLVEGALPPPTVWDGSELKLAQDLDYSFVIGSSENPHDGKGNLIHFYHPTVKRLYLFEMTKTAIPGAILRMDTNGKKRPRDLIIGPVWWESPTRGPGLYFFKIERRGARMDQTVESLVLRRGMVIEKQLRLNDRVPIHNVTFDNVSDTIAPLDACMHLFYPENMSATDHLQIPSISIVGDEGRAYGQGVMDDLLSRAFAEFDETYLEIRGRGRVFRKGLCPPHMQVIVERMLCYLLVKKTSYCPFHLPINLLAAIAGRPPTRKELIYFLKKYHPDLAQDVKSNLKRYAELDFESEEEMLAEQVGYSPEGVRQFSVILIRMFLPDGLNLATIDYHLSHDYETTFNGIQIDIVDGDLVTRYHKGSPIVESPAADKIRTVLDLMNHHEIRGFLRNTTGSEVPRVRNIRLILNYSAWIDFQTCFAKANISRKWVTQESIPVILRDMTSAVQRMMEGSTIGFLETLVETETRPSPITAMRPSLPPLAARNLVVPDIYSDLRARILVIPDYSDIYADIYIDTYSDPEF